MIEHVPVPASRETPDPQAATQAVEVDVADEHRQRRQQWEQEKRTFQKRHEEERQAWLTAQVLYWAGIDYCCCDADCSSPSLKSGRRTRRLLCVKNENGWKKTSPM